MNISSPRLLAALGVVSLTCLGMGGPVALADPAPQPVTPQYPDRNTYPSFGPVGTAMQIHAMDGNELGDLPGGVTIGGDQDHTMLLNFLDPQSKTLNDQYFPGSNTFALQDPRYAGDVQGTITPDPEGYASTYSAQSYGDSRMFDDDESIRWDERTNDTFTFVTSPGGYTAHLDFSTLAGGVLPKGSVIGINDIDVEGDVHSESATLTSSAGTDAWLEYVGDGGQGDPGPVTFDDGTYRIVPNGRTNNDLTQIFRTTQDLRTLDLHMTGTFPGGDSGSNWQIMAPAVPAGTFSITKNVEGTQAQKDATYTFDYTCTGTLDPTQGPVTTTGTVKATGDGTPVTADKVFPVGSTCSVTEEPAAVDDYSLGTTWQNQNFTIDQFKQVVPVTATNTYTPTGTLTWNKVDADTDAVLAGSQWTLTDDTGRSIPVVDNGTNDADDHGGRLQVENMPVGTYTLTETKAPKGHELSTGTWTQQITDAGQTVSFGSIENKATVVTPTPTPSPTPTPTPTPTNEPSTPAPTTPAPSPTSQPTSRPTTQIGRAHV